MKSELKFNTPITVTQPTLPDKDTYLSYVNDIWERKWLTNNGPLHEEFKRKLEYYLGTQNVELFTNGHLALEIALRTAIEEKGEIITTPFTFASTVHAIVNSGFEPVFCDIDRESYNIDVNKIEKYITPNTKAIVAVHVFGIPCDVQAIEKLANKHGLKVIYDAAHAFGVEIDGEGISNFGDVSMFSFHATKVFHSIEGGMLSYRDAALSTKLMAMKNFGMTSPDQVDYVGTNAKMNEFQAAMGLSNLEIVDQNIEIRKAAYETYLEYLSGIEGLQTTTIPLGVKGNYSYFPILLKSEKVRDQLAEKLKEYNVIARKYFYPLCNEFNCYDFNADETPVAHTVSTRILCLPMHANLTVEETNQICDIIQFELGDISE